MRTIKRISTNTALVLLAATSSYAQGTPYCAGDGCKACLRRGWVGKFVYDNAPDEMKAVRK